MDVHVSLVGRQDLSGEIYRQLRRAILDLRLKPGEPLPPTRELARRLSVSRTTVTVAYDRLIAEGFVQSRVGAGTFVSGGAARTARTTRAESGPLPHGSLRPRAVWDGITVPTPFDPPATFEFRGGLPDAALFPQEKWRRLMWRVLRADASVVGTYAHPAGHPDLRAAIARHIAVARGVAATMEDITITSGTQQALDVLARVLLQPGDMVAVEDPGYSPPRRLFQSLGLRIVGVPVDQDGLVVDALPRRARMVYVTPSHQYPLGVSLSLPRRHALLAWAERNDAAIIEDDYDSEFRFGGRPIEPLQTLDAAGRVVYVGSFSKTLLPALRLGFILAPPSLRAAVQKAKFVTDWHTSMLAQTTLAAFIEQGAFARHIRKARGVYAKRHELITRIVRRELGDLLELLPSDAGLHVAAVTRRLSAEQVAKAVQRAAAAGVGVHPLERFAVGTTAMAGVVIGYGSIQTAAIAEGLQRLRSCLEDLA